MREKLLYNWGQLSAKYPIRIVLISLLVFLAVGSLAKNLKMSTRWSDLLPTHDPLVREFNTILTEYTGTSNSIIVVRGPEQEIKRFADEIVPRVEAMHQYVKRVDYKIDERFIRQHGFMLTKSSDLEKSVDIYKDLNLIPLLTHINDSFERIYIGESESISEKEKQDDAIRILDGLQYWIETMDRYVSPDSAGAGIKAGMAVDRFMIGDPYFISPDKRTLAIFVEPAFSLLDMDPIIKSTDRIQALIDSLLQSYPDVRAGLTGTIPLSHDEMAYTTKDLQVSSVLAFVLVMALFIITFRLVTAPLLAGLNLIVSIIFAAGIISIFIHSLNIMTSMFAVILVGLGIDFSIHIISLYTERRQSGEQYSDAMSYALYRSGAGIITGAMTTSVAFLTLMISDTRGIKEMGFVLGLGVFSVMFVTIIFLPSLLILRERLAARFSHREENHAKTSAGVSFNFLGDVGQIAANRPVITLATAISLTLILLVFAINIRFDYNYMNMEPKGIPSVTLEDSLLTAFDISTDFVMITGTSVEEVRSVAEKAKKLPSVGMVESISNYIPSVSQQEERLPYINEIRSYLENSAPIRSIRVSNLGLLTDQLNRLDMNIYELGQMAFLGGQDRVDRKCSMIIGSKENADDMILALIDKIEADSGKAVARLNEFQRAYYPLLQYSSLRMADTSRISLATLPASIKDRFINKDGNRFLVTITPNDKVWDFDFMRRFDDQMKRISDKITGTPPLFVRLIYLIGRDGRRAAALALVTVFLLLLIDFRSLLLALMGMIPLVTGAVWMIGLLAVLGQPLTFVNVMGIPMIIGIGIDDGVHLLHRYRIEGWDKARLVLRSTGKAILLTSLTTMAGFGSLLIARYRGFVSLSMLLILGVGACFITTVIFLPAIVRLLKGRSGR